jgi:hypothetical protein
VSAGRRDLCLTIHALKETDSLDFGGIRTHNASKRAAGDPRLLGRGYVGARTNTTQQSGQTPDKEVDINHMTAYVSGYTETDTTGMLPLKKGPTVWRQQNGFCSSRQSDQIHAAVCIGLELLLWTKCI